MFFAAQVIASLCLLSLASAAPQYHPAPAPAYGDLAEPALYAFQYAVNDDYSGAQFQQTEHRDGYITSGSYTVALPDGRVQTVKVPLILTDT